MPPRSRDCAGDDQIDAKRHQLSRQRWECLDRSLREARHGFNVATFDEPVLAQTLLMILKERRRVSSRPAPDGRCETVCLAAGHERSQRAMGRRRSTPGQHIRHFAASIDVPVYQAVSCCRRARPVMQVQGHSASFSRARRVTIPTFPPFLRAVGGVGAGVDRNADGS